MSNLRFISIPPAALEDVELSAVDFRVLGAVARYDRMGGNGRGCFAAQATLAGDAKCDIRSVKRSLRKLADRGHLSCEASKKDARQRIYRVTYPQIGDKAVTYSDEGRGQPRAEIGDKVSEKPVFEQAFEGGKHNSKHIVLSEEANAEKTAPFSVPETGGLASLALASDPDWAPSFISKGCFNAGGYLAYAERELKRSYSEERAEAVFPIVEAVVETYPIHSPEYGVAYRLLGQPTDTYAMKLREEKSGAA